MRKVGILRNGRNQAVRIPVEFELQGITAIMRREGERLVIEPVTSALVLQTVATPAGIGKSTKVALRPIQTPVAVDYASLRASLKKRAVRSALTIVGLPPMPVVLA